MANGHGNPSGVIKSCICKPGGHRLGLCPEEAASFEPELALPLHVEDRAAPGRGPAAYLATNGG